MSSSVIGFKKLPLAAAYDTFVLSAMQLTLAQQAAEEAAWRQQVDQVHQQLLDQHKHKAALRQRLQQDAQRAKREQLRRIEPVAKARARASGLASLGLDPEIMALSEKFGRLSGLVDEVQQRMEAQYGLMDSMDDQAALGQLPRSAAGTAGTPWSAGMRLAAGPQHVPQQPLQMGSQAWPPLQQPQQGMQQQPQQGMQQHAAGTRWQGPLPTPPVGAMPRMRTHAPSASTVGTQQYAQAQPGQQGQQPWQQLTMQLQQFDPAAGQITGSS